MFFIAYLRLGRRRDAILGAPPTKQTVRNDRLLKLCCVVLVLYCAMLCCVVLYCFILYCIVLYRIVL